MLEQVDKALATSGLDTKTQETCQIVLAEILNNIVEHAYDGNGQGKIGLELWVAGETLAGRLRDSGRPLPMGMIPDAGWPKIDPTAPQDWPEGGFGWAIVRELTRDLRYCHDGASNCLRFEIDLGLSKTD